MVVVVLFYLAAVVLSYLAVCACVVVAVAAAVGATIGVCRKSKSLWKAAAEFLVVVDRALNCGRAIWLLQHDDLSVHRM